jgi:hypothetical protein
MISLIESTTSTYDAAELPVQSIRNLYAGLSRSLASQNSTAILYNLFGDSYNRQVDFVVTSGSHPTFPFWNLPVSNEIPLLVKPQRLSMKEARDLALKALTSAEDRRQREREAEAKFWAELD